MNLDAFGIGDTYTTQSYTVTEADIMEFAQMYDPQYMHIYKNKAADTRFKGIIASGIHTLALTFKLWVEEGKYGSEVIAGTEMNNVKFMKPVYPDDRLYVIVEVIDKTHMKETTGRLTVALNTYNQNEQKVFAGEVTALMHR
ncbi:MaoC/PaaZ C-terminal domain-containing protein [Staphylococcus arlettae]|uniref:MaoC/PaaZ C-terminal domain-containing protein n=1 Tax=Staphylococcus arlettae TaxID=29378 RepID=UPI001E5B4421|nr:MaoC/PaaZ C-terminal domain-containing protein [Staphylococcus arlettae]MCD8849343.1 MaoC family dehydratase N-terminal domain-containing protein [Staphylococcus arlettae]